MVWLSPAWTHGPTCKTGSLVTRRSLGISSLPKHDGLGQADRGERAQPWDRKRMKPCVCFIFFSWSVWLKASSMHPAEGKDENGKGHVPNLSDPGDDSMGSHAKCHPDTGQAAPPGSSPGARLWKWAGSCVPSYRNTGKPAIANHSPPNNALLCLLEF